MSLLLGTERDDFLPWSMRERSLSRSQACMFAQQRLRNVNEYADAHLSEGVLVCQCAVLGERFAEVVPDQLGLNPFCSS